MLSGQLDIPLAANHQLGGIFENFCILERLKTKLALDQSYNQYYWRSPDSEVDYIEQRGDSIAAYEIKWNKLARRPPPSFVRQFPDAKFVPINRENFWRIIAIKASGNSSRQTISCRLCRKISQLN